MNEQVFRLLVSGRELMRVPSPTPGVLPIEVLLSSAILGGIFGFTSTLVIMGVIIVKDIERSGGVENTKFKSMKEANNYLLKVSALGGIASAFAGGVAAIN